MFADDFEGAWPGPWDVGDSVPTDGHDFWGPVTCKPGGALSGTHTVWAAAEGLAADCGSSYRNNMKAWMVYGPFNLSNSIAGELSLSFVNSSELGHDYLRFLFSIDGSNFYGSQNSGTTPSYPNNWQPRSFDLAALPGLGNVNGLPLVWFAIQFASDATVSSFPGPYVDDVALSWSAPNACQVNLDSPADGNELCFPELFSWSASGNCENLVLALATDENSQYVSTHPALTNPYELDSLAWETSFLALGGSGLNYYWTLGEVYEDEEDTAYGPITVRYFFPRAPWRAFSACTNCPSGGACCTPRPDETACEDANCCEAVCATDAYCCAVRWDAMCASIASQQCGCSLCGNGDCGTGETCASCPADCTYAGSSDDCNGNTIPDGCDIATGNSTDCNSNGIPDDCDGALCLTEDRDAFITTSDKLWSYNLQSGVQALVGTATDLRWMSGAAFDPVTGGLYVIEEDALCELDSATAEPLGCGNHGLALLDGGKGLAFDGNGQAYLTFEDKVYMLDKSTGAPTLLNTLPVENMGATAFSPSGQLYALAEVDSLGGIVGLIELDPMSGEILDVVGPLHPGSFLSAGMGMEFDSGGSLYVSATGTNKLYRVDTTDASAAVVANIALTFGGLAIYRDCNANQVFDSYEVALGSVPDVDANGIPDGCAYCGDGNCQGAETLCTCPSDCGNVAPSEVAGSTCADTLDNDCDGTVDCADSDCALDDNCLPPPTMGGPGDLLTTGNIIERLDGVTFQHLHTFSAPNMGILRGITIGPDDQLYVVAGSARRVDRFELTRGFWLGTFVASEAGGLSAPWGLKFGPDGNLYVSDWSRNNVLRFDGTSGAFIDEFVTMNSGGLFRPTDLAFGPDGNLYVASEETHSVLRYSGSTGAFINAFVPTQSGGLLLPRGLTFGPDGNLYVTVSTNQGAVLRYAGATGTFIDAFIPPSPSLMSQPYGLAFGADGDLYVTSDITALILRFDGATGQFKEGLKAATGRTYIAIHPPECEDDADCDDAVPSTHDVCFTFTCRQPPVTRLYVKQDANGNNDGSSWTDAFSSLQAALDLATAIGPPLEIWVAQGVYTPNRGSGDRDDTFTLLDGVTLYGGFAGYESVHVERDPAQNPTILSGDYLSNDGPGFAGNNENAYHVVTSSASGIDAPAVLDGFIITGGNANGPSFEPNRLSYGGGLVNIEGSPTVRNCTFIGNRATLGGGAAFIEFNSTPLFSGCRFAGNTAASGGAIMSIDGWLIVANCLFDSNSATQGGALYTAGSRPTLTNCTVTGNTASSSAAGIHNLEHIATINNSILWNNAAAGQTTESAQLGGGNYSLSDTCVQGWTGSFGGTNNTGSCQPTYVDANGKDNVLGSIDDDYRLSAVSANIDVGNDSADIDASTPGLQPVPPRDAAGQPRTVNQIDRGAFEFVGVQAGRFIPITIAEPAGNTVALAVALVDLHRTTTPPTAPDFSNLEGERRYVQAFLDNEGNPSFACPDSVATQTSYLCAVLGCQPEYRDWTTLLDGQQLLVTGDAIVPSSEYAVFIVTDSLATVQNSIVVTSAWGDVASGGGGAPDGATNVIDIGIVVDKVKEVSSALPEFRCWLKNPTNALGHPVNVIDIGLTVDAVKGLPYPYTIAPCP